MPDSSVMQLVRKVFRVLAPIGSRRRRFLWMLRARYVRLHEPSPAQRLRRWYTQNKASASSLRQQRERVWPERAPRISLLIPAHSLRDVRRALRHLAAQTYGNWEIVFLGAPHLCEPLRQICETCRETAGFQPVSVNVAPRNALESGRQRATGDFVAVMSACDTLSPNALAEFAEYLLANSDLDVAYCDEDCRSSWGRKHGLRLKPGWSPEMLLGFHYIGRLCLIRQQVLQAAGGFDESYGDAQEYEALLRVGERTERIGRLPQCLYHRRAQPAKGPMFAQFGGAAEQRARAVRAHLARRGLNATVANMPDGTQRVTWDVADPPLVSIIIPTLNQPKVLRQCVEDLRHKTDYPRMEIILVDNNSTDPEVLAYYRELTRAGAARIVPFTKEFNYSEACNLGARAASGELLLFLNNDVSVIAPDWLMEMARFALLPGVGCVGTKLLYPNGIVQHAGVMIGMHMTGLVYNRAAPDHWDEFGSPNMYRNCLAIMGACQMIGREAFLSVGGFDERYRIANSDVAICLRLHGQGLRTVCTPHAALFHHEGYTRGTVNPAEDLALSGMDIRLQGIAEDPYFHPCLSHAQALPTLRLAPEPSPREALKQQLDAFCRQAPPRLDFDIFNDECVFRLLGPASAQVPLPRWEWSLPPRTLWEAARFILFVLRSSATVRGQFPQALSAGVDGDFCNWLCDEVRQRYQWPATALEHVRSAFRADPGLRVRQIYEIRLDLQVAFAGATLDAGRPHYFSWLAHHGAVEHDLRAEQIWWFVLQSVEDPVRELAWLYSITPAWKAYFPEAVTAIGWPAFYSWAACHFRAFDVFAETPPCPFALRPLDQLRVLYDNRKHWRALFPNAFHCPEALRDLITWLQEDTRWPHGEFNPLWLRRVRNAASGHATRALGLNVLGHFTYPSGLQKSVASLIKSLRLVETPTNAVDVPVSVSECIPEPRRGILLETHDVTLLHVQPEPFTDPLWQAKVKRGRDRYRIGMWYWEFGEVPSEWTKQARALNELWAPTRFIADALRKLVALPVVHMLPGVELEEVAPVRRADLGIPEDKVLFLFAYDMRSNQERKNPLGAIEAFRRAFRHDDRVHLAIKVSWSQKNPQAYAKLVTAASEAGVQVINALLPRSKAYGLMQCCDCYVSLHRSEGLGLTMAEAMLMGKPVIATAYSGNLDFMTPNDSLLVDYELTPLPEDLPPYKKGWLWAEPDLDQAVASMRWVYERRQDARVLGKRAQAAAETILSLQAAGERVRKRLHEIEALRQKKPGCVLVA